MYLHCLMLLITTLGFDLVTVNFSCILTEQCSYIIIIAVISIFQFIYNDNIGLYVQENRLHNPCGFVSD